MFQNLTNKLELFVPRSHLQSIKMFAGKVTLAKVIQLFRPNYIAINVTSVKIIRKYASSGVNYAKKNL
jgi:hypothetical protein